MMNSDGVGKTKRRLFSEDFARRDDGVECSLDLAGTMGSAALNFSKVSHEKSVTRPARE